MNSDKEPEHLEQTLDDSYLKTIGIGSVLTAFFLVTAIAAVFTFQRTKLIKAKEAQLSLFQPDGITNVVQFVSKHSEFRRMFRYQLNETNCVLVELPYPQIPDLVPSGPPVFIFNEEGQLIDWTPDDGDDSQFIRRWYQPMTTNDTRVRVTDDEFQEWVEELKSAINENSSR